MVSREADACLFRVAAALCRGDDTLLHEAFAEVLAGGASAVAVREIILTSYLFDGYPTALEGFRLWARMEGNPAITGDEIVYDSEVVELWRKRGRELCRAVYGPQFASLMERVRSFAPELSDAMIVEGYGKVLARGGIDILTRELCIVVMLTVKDRPRQLLSHALGALRLGATSAQLHRALDVTADIAGREHTLKARSIVKRAVSTFEQS